MSWQDQVAKKRSEVRARIPSEWTATIDSVVATADPSSNVLAQVLAQLLSPQELEITLKDASQLVPAIQSEELSSEQVVTAFAKKAAAVASLTNAVSEPLYTEAIARARELDSLPKNEKTKLPLFGLPITVKDSFNIPGVQSTLGTVSRIALPPASTTSPAVALLTRLGAIVIAKTNVPQAIITPEAHNNVFGRTLNPANPKEWGSGGSSGGEGVLISQRASALGLGTDLAGSIRVPAWSNGAYGYKPSLKIVPYLGFEDAGKPPREPGLTATVGPLAQSADDLELFLKSVIGARPWEDPELQSSLQQVEWKDDIPSTFTVGVLTGSPGVPISDQVKETVRSTAEKLQAAGHKLVWIDEAVAPSVADLTQQVGVPLISLDTEGTHLEAIRRGGEPLTPETARGHAGLFEPRVEKSGDDGSEQIYVAKVLPYTVSDEDLAKSKRLQSEFVKAWDDLFAAHQLDALICPLIDQFAPAHGEFDLTPFAINWNTIDYPAVSIPVNRHELAFNNRVKPQAVQLVAQNLEDQRLLAVTKALENQLAPFIVPFLLSIFIQQLHTVTAADPPPTVWINGSQPLIGTLSADGLVESYLGVPYAEPPVGPLRFRQPVPFRGSYTNFSATEFGPSCPAAISGGTLAAFDDIAGIGKYLPPHMRNALQDARTQMTPMAEDCLSLNVFCPAAKGLSSLLPVMVWIHGGAFQFGGSAIYPGDPFVRDGIALNLPVIVVTLNYRLGALGFLGGSAVLKDQQSANAGLHDQRLALEWVSKHIEAFGGDPNRIVIFGESAGAQSVYMHTVAHNINEPPLFSAAIMQSGSIIPTGYVDDEAPERLFRSLIESTGCDIKKDDGLAALECLRHNATLDSIMDFQRSLVRDQKSGIVTAYLGWSPRSDRDPSGLLPAPVHQLSVNPAHAIPQITGNQQDEGTLFALVLNATTGRETEELFQSMFGRASAQQIHQALALYPDNPFSGAPFDTGLRNAVTPQYKRLAAVLTDLIFQSGRRLALARMPVTAVPTYVYQSTALHNIIPVLGTFHANDLIWQWREDEDPGLRWPGRPNQKVLKASLDAVAAATQAQVYRRYFISFATYHDPNIGSGLPAWPRFSGITRDMLGIGPSMVYMDRDTFREEQIEFFSRNYAAFMM